MNAYWIGIDVSPKETAPQSVADALNRTGGNLGNLAFSCSIYRHLNLEFIGSGLKAKPENMADQADLIVIAAANWIRPDELDKRKPFWVSLAEIIEKSGLPVALLGVGAQADSVSEDFNMSDEMLRLLRAVESSGGVIGTRGEFTSAVLSRNGLTCHRTTGCPSLYYFASDAKIPTFDYRTAYVKGKGVVCGGTRYNSFRGGYSPVEVQLAHVCFERDWDYIAQSEPYEIASALGIDMGQHRVDLAVMSHLYGAPDEAAFQAFAKRRFQAFTDYTEWMTFMQDKSVYVGTRLHGAITALLSGVPGGLVVHDSRTKELAEYCYIPTLTIDQVEAQEFEPLLDQAEVFQKAWPSLRDNYVDAIKRCGLTLR